MMQIFLPRRRAGSPPPLYSEDFADDSDLANWYRGFRSVDGTWEITGGELVYTVGASDNQYPRIVRAVAGFTVGVDYAATVNVAGNGIPGFGVSAVSDGSTNLGITSGTGVKVLNFTATVTTHYFFLQHTRDPAVPGEICRLLNAVVDVQ